MAHRKLELAWETGSSKTPEAIPERWYPAMVPGAVQLDIAAGENYPPLAYGENWQQYRWMEDCYWTYRTHFPHPDITPDEQLLFISKGIDYQFSIILNQKILLQQEGMFTPVAIDLSPALQNENELIIIISPAPKMHPAPEDRTQAAQSVKPAVSYGWDWHPRLIPLGIWDETYLEVRQKHHLHSVELQYTLSDDLQRAEITCQAVGNIGKGQQFQWQLTDPNGNIVLSKKGQFSDDALQFSESLSAVHLWWPHDHGEQHLYRSIFQLLHENGDLADEHASQIGFRRVKLVMNEGAWDAPSEFPKSRSVPPIQIEINGRKIFGKGSNWVNPEIFPGIISAERYDELLDLAIKANFNLLRIWGGAIVNKASFHRLCDEKGILIWQDFPLACNNYEDSPEYLTVLEQEATSIIKRLRQHPSLAIWNGGNELFNNWSGMTDQSKAIRLLNSLTLQLDPDTPFIMSAPLMGMGHGHYVFRDDRTGEEVLQLFGNARNTAYTEFGVPSPADVDILKKIIPSDELWPPKPGASWESHHAFQAWDQITDTWLMQSLIESYFGKSPDLTTLVENGQLLQSEGYKFIYEEARRQKPYCSMAMNWCFNEPWPCAANNSLITYPTREKPALSAVGQACRPVLASIKAPRFTWQAGEDFYCETWILNDAFKETDIGLVTLYFIMGSEKIKMQDWQPEQIQPNQNLQGPAVRFPLPHLTSDRFQIAIEVADHPALSSLYTFLRRSD